MLLLVLYMYVCSVVGFPCGSAGKESACNTGDLGLIPGLGRSPGEGKSYPLQYSGLENSIDCIVHGITKSQTRLSGFHYAHLCPTLRDTMDCGPPVSSVLGILQARRLECVAISSSMESSQLRDRTCVSGGSDVGRQILCH